MCGHGVVAMDEVNVVKPVAHDADGDDLVVVRACGEQPAHCRGGGVVEDNPVEPDAEVLLRRAAEHQHGDGVDQRLGGDLVGM